MVTLTNALIMFAFGYVRALYNTFKHIYVEEGWPWGGVQKWLWFYQDSEYKSWLWIPSMLSAPAIQQSLYIQFSWSRLHTRLH